MIPHSSSIIIAPLLIAITPIFTMVFTAKEPMVNFNLQLSCSLKVFILLSNQKISSSSESLRLSFYRNYLLNLFMVSDYSFYFKEDDED